MRLFPPVIYLIWLAQVLRWLLSRLQTNLVSIVARRTNKQVSVSTTSFTMADFLPSETWQTILRYAISVPVFFSSNPVVECGSEAMNRHYYDREPYYAAEKTRNRLRLVCSSWKDYLTRYSHRFLDLKDLLHGKVEPEVVSKVIRLNIQPCQCCLPKFLEYTRDPSSIFARDKTQLLALEILEGRWSNQREILSLLHMKAPNLRCLQRQAISDLGHIVELFPAVTFLNGRPIINPFLSTGVLTSNNLTTLSLVIPSLSDCCHWTLGSLRHLSFYIEKTLIVDDYIEMLERVGTSLVTLHDLSWGSNQTLPDNVWRFCPRLKSFQTSLLWPSEASISSSLQSIRVKPGFLKNEADIQDRLPISAMIKVGITTIRYDITWWEIVRDDSLQNYIALGPNGELEGKDIAGSSFSEFIIMLIQVYWKGIDRDSSYTGGNLAPMYWMRPQ